MEINIDFTIAWYEKFASLKVRNVTYNKTSEETNPFYDQLQEQRLIHDGNAICEDDVMIRETGMTWHLLEVEIEYPFKNWNKGLL